VPKSIRVATPQARAFEVFTAGLDRWRPTRGSEAAIRFIAAAEDSALVERAHRLSNAWKKQNSSAAVRRCDRHE
jgi:hypothetical protein